MASGIADSALSTASQQESTLPASALSAVSSPDIQASRRIPARRPSATVADESIVTHEVGDKIILDDFEEVRGRFLGVKREDGFLTIRLSVGRLRYSTGSPEAGVLSSALKGQEGATVAILRLPNPNDPLAVVLSEHEPNSNRY